MKSFIDKHQQKITGTISIFDRIIFKGYLPFGYPEAMERFLYRNGLLIKDFSQFGKKKSQELKKFAIEYAEQESRPYKYLAKKIRKEELARQIAETDEVSEGLICIFATLEQNPSFCLRYGEKRPRLASCFPKCLTLYFYYLDRQFGFMHVRLQTWLPFMIQVYINGHEWLARKLGNRGVGFEKIENAFISIDDFARAQKIADTFPRRKWEKILDVFAQRVNPLLNGILTGFTYYWVTAQAEYATDILFQSPAALNELYLKLQRYATVCFSAEDVMKFLGRKLNGNFCGEVRNEFKKRLPGARIKHRMKENWIKMYDKFGCVLRVETVINHPYEFRIRRLGKRNGEMIKGWFPMAKRVSNLYRYAEVSMAANRNYLEALSIVDDPTEAYCMIDRLCEPAELNGKRKRGFNPIRRSDLLLFTAVMRGEHHVHGFRNGQLASHMGIKLSDEIAERRRQTSRIGRLLQLLRAHGLIAKIPRSRRYRVTLKGVKLMAASIHFRDEYLPNQITATA